jgi:hypothetical protein
MRLNELLYEEELEERGFLNKIYDKALAKVAPNTAFGDRAAGRVELDKLVKLWLSDYRKYLGKIGSEGSFRDVYAFLVNIVEFDDTKGDVAKYLTNNNIRLPFTDYRNSLKQNKKVKPALIPYSDRVVKDIFYMMGQYAYQNNLIDVD